MRILVWNCRGLGTAAAIRSLCDLVSSNRPLIIGLVETKLQSHCWEGIKRRLGFTNCFVVPASGKSGGLALLWKNDVNLVIRNYSFYHVDAIFDNKVKSRFTLYYGSPYAKFKENSLNIIRTLACFDNSVPWCIGGDFNEILNSEETTGCYDRRIHFVDLFRSVMQDCGLFDLNYRGHPYTYSNRRIGSDEVKSRLDRFIVNATWRQHFPDSFISHLVASRSDHRPIILITDCARRMGNKQFIFEDMWYREQNFNSLVENWWLSSGCRTSLSAKLKELGQNLFRWNHGSFGRVNFRLQALKHELEEIKNMPRSYENAQKEFEISSKIDEWLHREEIMWRQRSRNDWLNLGDNNTKFFHQKASSRQRMNRISYLVDDQGIEHHLENDISDLVVHYFKDLYMAGSDTIASQFSNADFDIIMPKVTAEDNSMLLSRYTAEEVKTALWQLHPLKAPGPDGFSATFFQKSWEVIGNDFTETCLKFLNENILDRNLNNTTIALIPKLKEARKIQDYRPISLCNITMRVISKVLANRLQGLLDKIISPMQTAFIKGRNIIDNITVSHEMAEYIRRKTKGITSYCSIKLDMAKAFDRMSWDFLNKVLHSLGFDGNWIAKIYSIISTVMYQVRINGKLSEPFCPKKGLRQGDPLSPYLFILGTEWLSAALLFEQNRRNSFGIKICRGAPVITHLFFADDSMFFMKNTEEAFRRFKDIMSKYEHISGQLINYSKSEVVFSRNTRDLDKNLFLNILGVSEASHHKKYLGLPTVVGSNKCQLFNNLSDRVWAKIKNWKFSFLSAGGKEILIKAVLQALPQYTFSMFLVPDKIIKAITGMINRFWWTHSIDKKGVCWVKKEEMYKRKELGGLGFRDLKLFNLAMLAKQGWRIMSNPNMLMSKVLKAKYFPNSNFLQASLGYRPTYGWRSIMKGAEILRDGCDWDNQEHRYIWKFESDKMFSVKSAYWHAFEKKSFNPDLGEASSQHNTIKFWRAIWRCQLPRKIKIHAWKLFHQSLPVGINLRRIDPQVNTMCRICSFKEENNFHLILQCWWSRCLWRKLGLDWVLEWPEGNNDIRDWIYSCQSRATINEMRLILVSLWFIWYNRNLIWHGNQGWNPDAARIKICSLTKSYTSFNFWNSKVIQDRDMEWKKPEKDHGVKFNCDGAFCPSSGRGAVAVVGRDSQGSICHVYADKIQQCKSPLDAEGNAVWRAMKIANDLGYDEAIFEIDSANLAEYILKGSSWDPSFHWVNECQKMIIDKPFWRISLVMGEANNLADKVAKKVLMSNWCWVKVDAIPLLLGYISHL